MMKINRGIFLTIVLLFGLAISSSQLIKAETYCDTVGDLGNCYVDGSVTASGDGKTPATAFKTIQEAADVVGPGDTVNVRGEDDGGEQIVYSESTCSNGVVCPASSGTNTEHIVYKSLPNQGTPIIDGGASKNGFFINFTQYIEISGLKITNATNGIFMIGEFLYVYNNIFYDNSGNGLNLITLATSVDIDIYNNTIESNAYGIAIQFSTSTVTSQAEVHNNIITNNSVCGITNTSGIADYTHTYNIIWNNSDDYCNDMSADPTEINSDPIIIDSVGGNFKLRADSPAIDAGITLADVTDDIVGTARPFGDGYDIGAYENRHYYVDGSDTGPGDDTNPGSRTAPWKTIQKGADTMVAGDTVNVRGRDSLDNEIIYADDNPCAFYGYQSGTVCLSSSGTEDNPITYQSWAGTGNAIIEALPHPTYGRLGSGFVVDYTSSNVSNNIIRDFIFRNTDNALSISSYTTVHNNKVINNLIYDEIDTGYSVGISFGNSENSINYAYYNTIIGKTLGIHSNAGELVVKNNNIIGGETGISQNRGMYSKVTTDYNNVYGNEINFGTGIYGKGDYDISLDPKFVDPDNYNFSLQNDSPLIDSGININRIVYDSQLNERVQGNKADIGAFETTYTQNDPPNSTPISTYQKPPNSMVKLALYDGEPDNDGNTQFGMTNGPSCIDLADVNNDGIDDLLVGARQRDPDGGLYVFLGKSNLEDTEGADADYIIRGPRTGHGFTNCVITGDYDGDGKLEVVAGDYQEATYGKTFIFDLDELSPGVYDASSSSFSITGMPEGENFSFGSQDLGDIDGDGLDDFAVIGVNHIYVFKGRQSFYSMTADNADMIITLDATSSSGFFIARDGDVNADGLNDIVLNCSHCSVKGTYIFFGRKNLSNKTISEVDVLIDSGSDRGGRISLADINNDGIDDIISVANPLHIFKGSKNFNKANYDQADYIISPDPNAKDCEYLYDGAGLESGDINNDGKEDLIIGYSCYPRAFVFFGSENFISKDLSQANLVYDDIYSPFASSAFGDPLAIGDHNGDGYLDIASGAGLYNIRQGRASVFSTTNSSLALSLIIEDNHYFRVNNPVIRGEASGSKVIQGVEISVNGDDWKKCAASDGTFNSSNEAYYCELFSLSEGNHVVKTRSYVEYGIYIPEDSQAVDEFIVDTITPNPKLTQLGTLSVTLDNVNGAHWYYTGTKPKFIGTSEANSTTKFTIEEVDSKDIGVSSEGSWDYENQLTTQTYEVSFFGRDAAGNVSGTQSFLLTIDPTAQSFPDYIKEKLGVGMSDDEKQEEIINDEAGEEDLIIEQSNGDLYEAEEVPEDNTGDGTDSQPSEPEGDPGQIGGQSIFQQAGFWLLCVLPLIVLLVVVLMILYKNRQEKQSESQ